MTLEYGNTEKQTVGDIYVTDVSSKIETLFCKPQYTDMININDSADTIALTLSGDFELNKEGKYPSMNTSPVLYCPRLAGESGFDADGYYTESLTAQVSDWSNATPGATYQATITYVVITY